MKKIELLLRGLTFLTFILVLTLGLLIYSPPDKLYASPSNKDKPVESTEQIDGTAGASKTGTPTFEHYEPLPIEPIHREANNVLLGSGLGVAALIIGGAFVMDKRNQ
jgi:hypothetical protein